MPFAKCAKATPTYFRARSGAFGMHGVRQQMHVKIGQSQLEAIYDPAPADGYVYTVQINSNAVGTTDEKFYPRQLSGISGLSFPDNCDLVFYNFKSSFKNIYLLRVQKLNGHCNVVFTVSLNFSNWDLPDSLGSFVDRYTAGIMKDSPFSAAIPSKCEYGFDIDCSIPINDSDDLFKKITETEARLESIYRKHLIPPSEPSAIKYGEERMHWWIRYVIVPIICSGTIATVIARYLLK